VAGSRRSSCRTPSEFPVSLKDALPSLTRVGATNGCDTNVNDQTLQQDWHPEISRSGSALCRSFFKCPKTHPVVLCTTTGINQTNDEVDAVPAFTRFFDELAAQTAGGIPIP
jgi:hypothetical protein